MMEMAICCLVLLSVTGGIVAFRDKLADKYCGMSRVAADSHDTQARRWDPELKACVAVETSACPEGFVC